MKQFNNTTILLTLIFVILAFSAVFFYKKSMHADKKLPQQPAPTKTIKINPNQDLLSDLDKRLILPKGDSIIFNLSDLASLTNQPFFNGSKPTDKLILFQEEKKAVLYDPIAKQIINIGPLVIVPATPEAQISEAK